MDTTFEVRACHEDAGYASQAAHAAFGSLDRLEQELSRFVPTATSRASTTWRPGRSTRVSASTLECLPSPASSTTSPAGAFDVSIGDGARGARASSRTTSRRSRATQRRPLDLGRHRQGLRGRPHGRACSRSGGSSARSSTAAGARSWRSSRRPARRAGRSRCARPSPGAGARAAAGAAASALGFRDAQAGAHPRPATGRPVARGAVWVGAPARPRGRPLAGRGRRRPVDRLHGAPGGRRRRALPVEPRARGCTAPPLS